MKFEEKVELVSVLCEDIKKLHKLQNKGEKLFGLFTDGCKYGDVMNVITDHYLNAVALQVGDTKDWLSWFIYDSDFGKKNGIIEIEGGEYIIKTIEDLVLVMDGKLPKKEKQHD